MKMSLQEHNNTDRSPVGMQVAVLMCCKELYMKVELEIPASAFYNQARAVKIPQSTWGQVVPQQAHWRTASTVWVSSPKQTSKC
jgi:hypothetical protein